MLGVSTFIHHKGVIMDKEDELLADFVTAFAHALSESVRAMAARSQRKFTPHAIGGDIRQLANSLPNDRPRVKDIMLQIAEEMTRSKSSHRI